MRIIDPFYRLRAFRIASRDEREYSCQICAKTYSNGILMISASYRSNLQFLLVAVFCLNLVVPSVLGESTRGLAVVPIKDPSGNQVGLYKGSHALVIGVADYKAGWPKLPSVAGEVRKIKGALEGNGFNVVSVLNPDGEGLENAFDDFIKKHGYDRDNRLLFFFSGHGYSRGRGAKGYLVPSNAPDPRRNEKDFLRKALPMSQILAWCRQMESKHALFLFDSCFSGTIFKTKALPKIPPHISAITSKPVRQFIAAGDAGEEVPAKSVFAASFLRALRGEGDLSRDGYITGMELGMYLRDKLLYYQTGQTPQYGKIRDPELDEGDFVFLLSSTVGAGRLHPAPVPNSSPAVTPVSNRKQDFRIALGQDADIDMIWVEGGSFMMGDNYDDEDARPAHQVSVNGFWISRTEITRGQWAELMGEHRSGRKGSSLPVVSITWDEAMSFCSKLSKQTRRTVSLPSEAEWEYACRGGTTGRFFFKGGLSDLSDHAWFRSNAARQSHVVGELKPNELGLYDMLGNVWEWCDDWYDAYPGASRANKFMGTSMRVLRGGCYQNDSRMISCPGRSGALPNEKDSGVGFRIVCR